MPIQSYIRRFWASGTRQVLLILSLLVTIAVFWSLKLTGITMAGEAFCGKDEHTHSDACLRGQLLCPLEEVQPHTHDEACLFQELICTLEESPSHTHDETCLDRVLHCQEAEVPGHIHEETCYQTQITCTQPEGQSHIHTDDCHEVTLICQKEESDTYTHSAECFRIEENLICGMEETDCHVHTEACEESILICSLEEQEGHTHGDSCYTWGSEYLCGLEESRGHSHSDDCWLPVAGEFVCGLNETEGHIHGDACYEALESCPLEEHIHEESCYSDLNADLETSDDWEMTLAGLQRSPRTVDNILAVARSQLGYTESTRNFQIDENGIRRGITRYGQWYGNPYGQWSAMFTSFCLTYAGVDTPVSAGPETLRVEWDNAGLYGSAADTVPLMGYLLFLDKDLNGAADAVAIISELDPMYTAVIEGDWEDQVAEVRYDLEAPEILGYGLVPMEDAHNPMVLPGSTYIANTTAYQTNLLVSGNSFVFYTTVNGESYAIDGNGNAVPVYIDANGAITANISDSSQLLWNYVNSNNNYRFQNAATGRYLAPGNNTATSANGTDISLRTSGSGVRIRNNNRYYALLNGTDIFVGTQAENQSSVFQLGMVQTCTVWLDGTCGGVDSLLGAAYRKESAVAGEPFRLPNANDWALYGPPKYDYVLRGWYDVVNHKYYAPGETVIITGDTVFYADWVARTYDIGVFNAQVSNTVSTNSFITTHLFDYNYLFNVLSADAQVTVSSTGHTEVWSIDQNESVDYENRETLNFIFLDYRGDAGPLDYPNNRRDGVNQYPGEDIVTGGIYNAAIGEALFSTGDLTPGKTYLGTGDHLFQIMDDPDDPHYGYYYYDSARNAAAYNQSQGRFYVYDYLEATNAELSDTKSDFLPLNSPYANTNGNSVPTTDHTSGTKYVYDAKYADSTDRVSTNYAYGMKTDIRFYLPNKPGEGGNQDLYGNDMIFEFSGDDDLWVLVDGVLALDIGGIHQAEKGMINFSTGEVTVQGVRNDALSAAVAALAPGEHTLTVMYLERGASHSNCAIYFNLAPRFKFSIQKEDVLTRDVLNGAQFSVYRDEDCTQPAELWVSEESYLKGDPATNVFTVTNGVANMWGMGAGNTYYIRETKAPDNADYGFPNGIIRLVLDKKGAATYSVIILPDTNGQISGGFTVHGFRVDEETQQAYIIATNAPKWVKEVTSVQVQKFWTDDLDHSSQSVTVYLTVTDPDGTVRRLQEALLNSEKDWQHLWENLPKYYEDGTEIQYSVEEAYVSGYYSSVQPTDTFTVTTSQWTATTNLENGKTYLLKSGSGYLSTLQNASDTGYMWVDEAIAKSSSLAQWKITQSGNTYKLTNAAGQTITFYYGNGSPTDFYASTGGESTNAKQYFRYSTSGGQIRLYYDAPNNRDYYLRSSMTSAKKFQYSTSSGDSLLFTPMTLTATTVTKPVEGDQAYQITNTPLEQETSLTVRKQWQIDSGDDPSLYQQAQVTVKLLANGKDTGRTVTLSLKNGWVDVFRGLPYEDSVGNVIQYTVEESWENKDWLPIYGEVTTSGGITPTYSTTVTNHYRWGHGVELPSTGSPARMLYILCGSSIMLFSLVYGIGSRRKRERRSY